MVKFREHRELLEDAMKTIIEVSSLEELRNYILKEYHWYNKDSVLKIEHYTYDDRVDWDTFIVTVDGQVVGFTNGNLI